MTMTDRVHNLVGRYCEAVLRNDLEVFASTWTEHAVWSIPGAKTLVGRADIVREFGAIRGIYRLCLQQILNGQIHETAPNTRPRRGRCASCSGAPTAPGVS